MHYTEHNKERVVLISIDRDGQGWRDLNELSLLIDTAGAVEVGRVIQKREAMHSGHYLGKGKLDEVLALIEETDADTVCADDELTASQQKNLAKKLGVKVIDRTMVILDIFAARAATAEGKAQVELAQYRYRLSHLIGLGVALSRQAGVAAHGGVGNRGPGEKKLELDRRHIRNRIDQLSKELKEISQNRGEARKKRLKNKIPVIALVGYTNSGKSTLLNALTGSDAYVENQLFATLDTTTRKTVLPEGGQEVLFTDTVGFINKLPHSLIKAFHATLEELTFADMLLHVVDFSSEDHRMQMEVVDETLKSLKVFDKPIITVLNKIDKAAEAAEIHNKNPVQISAKNGTNLDKLLITVEETLLSQNQKVKLLLPYTEGALLSKIHGTCKVLVCENTTNGTYLEIYATEEIKNRTEFMEVNYG